jgi:hypothetical protein
MHTRTYIVQGNKWMVDPWGLMIPEHSIEGMTAREIGEHVLSLMKKAQEIRENEERSYFYPSHEPRKSNPSKPSKREQIYALLVERGGGAAYCNVPGCIAEGPYEIDHIVPKSRGGSNELDNLQLLCPRHNNRKSAQSWEAFLFATKE